MAIDRSSSEYHLWKEDEDQNDVGLNIAKIK